MNKVYFKPSEEFLEKANQAFKEQKNRIHNLIPTADIEHIGSTAIPSSVTKGDLDINIRVVKEDFNKAVEILKQLYDINQPENWNSDFASFKNEKNLDIDFGVQLTVKGSKY